MSNQPNALRLRPILRSTHNWIGLIAGLVIVVVSLTGSVIVFRDDVRSAQLPRSAGATSTRASLNEVSRQVLLARPGALIRRVRLPGAQGDPYVVQIESAGKTERVVSDASTARIVGTLDMGWIDWTVDLHRNLLYGRTGRSAVGALGVILFVLATTGLLLWMAGARSWRSWVSVRRGVSSRRFNFDLHRVIGLWSYGLLAAIAFTGIGVSYPDTFRQALRWMTGDPAPTGAPRIADTSTVQMRPLDDYLRIGQAAMPDGEPVELRFPLPGRGPVDLRLTRAGDLSASANRVYLEPATAAVLSVSRAVDRPVSARIFAAVAPIHYGEFGGFPIKALWALTGATPAVLFVTGLIAWWRPKKRDSAQAVEETVPTEDAALAGR